MFARLGISLIAVGWITLAQIPLAQGSTSLRGENRTCRDYADLDYALDHPTSAYFRGWSSSDFDAADTWVTACFGSPPTPQDIERKAKLAERRRIMDANGEIKRNDEILKNVRQTDLEVQRENEAKTRDAENAQRSAEATQRTNYAAARAAEARRLADQKYIEHTLQVCHQSTAYQIYFAATQIFLALDRQSRAQQLLEHEERVEGVSGTTNLLTKRMAGELLIGAQDDLNKWWATYQRYDTGIKNPESIPRTVADPCT
jgi:hypothetical protein